MDERRGTTERRMGILDELSEFWDDCQQLYRSLTFARDLVLDQAASEGLIRGTRELTEKALLLIKRALNETAGTTCENFPLGTFNQLNIIITSTSYISFYFYFLFAVTVV